MQGLDAWKPIEVVRCYLAPDRSADIKMYYIPKQSYWIVHSDEVEGIEFAGCDYSPRFSQ
jgi:hypothetical protein